MKLTDEQRRRLAQLKHDANQAKSALIRILPEVETMSASEGLRLSRAIEALERWQNAGVTA